MDRMSVVLETASRNKKIVKNVSFKYLLVHSLISFNCGFHYRVIKNGT